MKILQLCNRIPFPPKDGGSIAMLNMAKGFHQLGHDLTLFAINTPKHLVEEKDFSDDFKSLGKINSVFVDTSVKPIAAFLNLFSKRSYNIQRFISEEVKQQLITLLQKENYDVIQVESLFMAPYIDHLRSHSNARIVLRAHNVEHIIWQRLAQQASGLKKWYLQLLAKRLKNFEITIIKKFDAIAAITPEDEQTFRSLGYNKKIIVSPVGIDFDHYSYQPERIEKNTLFHLGALNWMPNLEGVQWFTNEVWRKKFNEDASLKFYIAGRHIPSEFYSLRQSNLFAVGEVDDAIDFMNTKQIMIVPLFSGGGMRVKIIEGMALGKVIISTSIGAEGIDYTDRKNILIANTAEEFAEAIDYCKQFPEQAEQISLNAIALAKEKYNNTELVRKLIVFYTDGLKN